MHAKARDSFLLLTTQQWCTEEQYTDQVAVVSPWTELHEARLFVEWEVLDIDLAERLVDGRRFPNHFACVMQNGLRHDGDLVVAVGTETHRTLSRAGLLIITLLTLHALEPCQSEAEWKVAEGRQKNVAVSKRLGFWEKIFESLLFYVTSSIISLSCIMILHGTVSSKPFLSMLTLTSVG